jgi:hypothetical protein
VPTLKKAFRYDDNIVFYYDSEDTKYIAKGGSLAWRLNNPGLISSHNSITRDFKIIGSCKGFAIFPSTLIGKAAHRTWIISSKYYDEPLVEIAKYYNPSHPEAFLKQLSTTTSLEPACKPRTLKRKDFESLLLTIQELAGFRKEQKGEFYPLPKITGKIHSHNQKIDLYITDSPSLLTRAEAIDLIETHKLDAVIVHKQNGIIYLRSRPGHHFDQIHLSEAQINSQKTFEDAVRAVGKYHKGQCIWGYINGMSTPAEREKHCATLISKYAEGEHVWCLVNAPTCENWGTVKDLLSQKVHKINETQVVKNASQFFKFLIDISNQDLSHPPIVIFAHSQGALIADLALNYLTSAERNRIHIFTLGGASFIPHGKAHPDSHNYFSIADKIPLFASKESCRILLKLRDSKKGLTPSQIIDECIKEDLIVYSQEPFNEETVSQFKQNKLKFYQRELANLENVTILERTTPDFCEHNFELPSYQAKIKEIVDHYRKKE